MTGTGRSHFVGPHQEGVGPLSQLIHGRVASDRVSVELKLQPKDCESFTSRTCTRTRAMRMGLPGIGLSNFSYIKIAEAALLSLYATVGIAAVDAVLRCDLFRARYWSYWTTSRTALALLDHARRGPVGHARLCAGAPAIRRLHSFSSTGTFGFPPLKRHWPFSRQQSTCGLSDRSELRTLRRHQDSCQAEGRASRSSIGPATPAYCALGGGADAE